MGMFAGKTMAAGGSFPWRVLLPQKLAKVFMKNEFYTYAYLRKDGTPYYIGKGKGGRAYSCTGKPCKMPSTEGRILILKKNLTEEEAFKHEIYMIAVFGRKDNGTGILRNLSAGGQGKTGYIHREESKAKISEKVRGQNHPLFGTSPSQETREKMSMTLKGRVIDEEWRRKMSEAHKGKEGTYGFQGKSHTEETLQKMRLRRWWNDGTRNRHCEECPGEGWVSGMLLKPKGGK
jgi:hypothetical protein